jgi:hypothetical protein
MSLAGTCYQRRARGRAQEHTHIADTIEHNIHATKAGQSLFPMFLYRLWFPMGMKSTLKTLIRSLAKPGTLGRVIYQRLNFGLSPF